MTTLISLLIALPTLLTLCFAVEVFVGLRPLPDLFVGGSPLAGAVIIVPAHDEEPGLARSLQRLKESAEGQAHILLVADNCTDATARIGRDLGVDVLERFEPERRGKGFALDFARTHLMLSPPTVVLIVDADCYMDRASVKRLARACLLSGRPCQATNLQRPRSDASPAVQLSTFAFFVKNVIRQRALQRLARRVHLLGTGMAFPWPIFARAGLATSNIVEDLALGQELAGAGHAPVFVEKALVWSNAETQANTIAQRRRWEGGFIRNALRSGPDMLLSALVSVDPRRLWAGINTMIPPFALLILGDMIALSLAVGLTSLTGAHWWPVLWLFGALTMTAVALSAAWTQGGSDFVSMSTLLRAPLYVIWKLPMYLAFARRGAPNEWMRTGRS